MPRSSQTRAKASFATRPDWISVHDDRIAIRLTNEAIKWITQHYGERVTPHVINRVAESFLGKGWRRRILRSRRGVPALPRPSSDILSEIIAKRQADLLTTAHTALASLLRRDKEFARRYPTLDIQPSRVGNEVKVRFGTTKQAKARESDLRNIDVFLHLSRGESPTASRRALALYLTHKILTTVVIPRLLPILPSVNREDVVTLIRDTWPSSRGIRSKPMFDRNLVRAAYEAVKRENPHWAARSIHEDLARRLSVSPRTVVNLIRKKS